MGKTTEALRKAKEVNLDAARIEAAPPIDAGDAALLQAMGRGCGHCGCTLSATVKLQKCGNCLRSYYCGAVCQKAGWRWHKGACWSKEEIRTATHTPGVKLRFPTKAELANRLEMSILES